MGFVSRSYAAAITVPISLSPGDHYRIVFLTSTSRDATSTDIADYNAFVNDVANGGGSDLASLGATWKVIGSTQTVDAIDNIGIFTTPLYGTDGLSIASGSTSLWSGSLNNAISHDEQGAFQSNSVHTGTTSTGLKESSLYFGNSGAHILDGLSYQTDSYWVTAGVLPAFVNRPLYGVSSDLIVPGGVPEPGTIGLMLVGAMFVVGMARYQRIRAARETRQSTAAHQ